MTHGDDILMTLKTIGENTLVTRMTSDEDTLMTPVATCDYLVTAPNDLTDNPCDNINVEEQLAGSIQRKAYGRSHTWWQQGWQGDDNND